MSNLTNFYKFITERQNIFQRRFIDKQEPSWTQDEILSKYSFTLPYRELDRVSLNYICNVARPDLPFFSEQEKIDLVFSTIFYRLFNSPITYKHVSSNENQERLLISAKSFKPSTIIKSLESMSQPMLHKAYTVSSHTHGIRTHVDIVKNILKHLTTKKGLKILSQIVNASSGQEAFNHLHSIYGLGGGGFMSAQVLADLNYSSIYNFDVEQSFVVSGPGCYRGIRRIFTKEQIRSRTDVDIIRFLRNKSNEELAKNNFPFFRGRKLSLQSIEAILCEYDKYIRMKKYKNGTGQRATLRRFRQSDDRVYLDMLNSNTFLTLYMRWITFSPEGFF